MDTYVFQLSDSVFFVAQICPQLLELLKQLLLSLIFTIILQQIVLLIFLDMIKFTRELDYAILSIFN